MISPFQKRASEHLIRSEAFLPLVSPAPLEYILNNYKLEKLLDKIVFVLGTPGSGKTTFGRLFELESLYTLHERSSSAQGLKPLVKVLSDFGVLNEDGPTLLAARLPMDTEYREIWELPYEESVKRGLFLKLLQSRCVLVWCNALTDQGVQVSDVEVLTKSRSPSAVGNIGGSDLIALRNKAAEVESQVYKIIHSLVPKSLDSIASDLEDSYEPLSHLIEFNVKFESSQPSVVLRPMLIVDDAHELHPTQFTNLVDYLINRELSAARWIMTRYDVAISANDWIQTQSQNDKPGRQFGRDFEILLTSQTEPNQKRPFKNAALDIANRYLQEMPVFNRAQQTKFNFMLMETCNGISAGNVEKLRVKIKSDIANLRISQERVEKINVIVDGYLQGKGEPEDVQLEMLRILLHRYSKRTPQQELFTEAIDIEPSRELKADAGVMAGAKLHLMHEFDRPFYYGFEAVANSGGCNIEQFLRTADVLVSNLEAKLIRKKQKIVLSAEEQHKIIKTVALETISTWDFPMHRQVIQLVDFIGAKALEASLQPNAYLDQGANAYGVLRSDFESMRKRHPQLSLAIHYAIAYNAISIAPAYHCKNEIWTLIQLGGYPIIKHGLPFNRGGFVEGGMKSLFEAIIWDQ